eukprot:11216946-Lingulodinium_polyedra.AAC.1
MTPGTGKARRLKGRLTLLCRQGLEGLFGQEAPSLSSLKGRGAGRSPHRPLQQPLQVGEHQPGRILAGG